MCRYVLTCTIFLYLLFFSKISTAFDKDQYYFDKGNYDNLSSEVLESKTKGVEESIASWQRAAEGWPKKAEAAKAALEENNKQYDNIINKREEIREQIFQKCYGGNKARFLGEGESSCSEQEEKEMNNQFQQLSDMLAPIAEERDKLRHEQEWAEKSAKGAAEKVKQEQERLAKVKQVIEERKAPVVTPPPVEEEAEPEEVDGVLPPAAKAEPAKAEAPKQEEIIGMASPAKAAKTADTATNVTADTGAKKTTKTVSSSKTSGALFGTLTQKAAEVFTGLREIIFAVAGFGITAVAIGGFFGNLNWKWLSAIIIGLVVISTTSAIINYMVDSDAVTGEMITDTLISAR